MPEMDLDYVIVIWGIKWRYVKEEKVCNLRGKGLPKILFLNFKNMIKSVTFRAGNHSIKKKSFCFQKLFQTICFLDFPLPLFSSPHPPLKIGAGVRTKRYSQLSNII